MTDIISLLKSVQNYIFQICGPILIGLGTVSCVLSLFVFNKKALRKNPCSIYFTAYHIVNFLIIWISLFNSTLSNGYDISLTSINLRLCRFTIYIALIGNIVPQSYLILASIDRILITSSSANTRHRSTRRLAYLSTILVTLFWSLLHIHTFFFINIFQLAPNYYLCYFTPGIYFVIISYYSFIVISIITPLCMIIFGLWTLKNLREIRQIRAVPISNTHISYLVHPKDRQFIRILVLDSTMYTVCSFALSCFLLQQQVTQYHIKSPIQIQIEIFVRSIMLLVYFFPYCASLYTNSIGSKTFRKEVKMTLCCQ